MNFPNFFLNPQWLFCIWCCYYALFLSDQPPSYAAAAAAQESTQLAHQVCRNTTDYAFCEAALYSDPRTPTADRYVLAYVSFDLAYLNATSTGEYIPVLLKNSTGRDRTAALRKCQSCYQKAVRVLSEAINDLNSESFYDLGRYALESDRAGRDCEAAFGGVHSPLSVMNRNLWGLSGICGVVSKLFIVT